MKYLGLLSVVAVLTFVISYVAAAAIEYFGHHDVSPATVDIEVDEVLARTDIARFDEDPGRVYDRILLITLDTSGRTTSARTATPSPRPRSSTASRPRACGLPGPTRRAT